MEEHDNDDVKPIEVTSNYVTYHGTIDRENNIVCEDLRWEAMEEVEDQASQGQDSGTFVISGVTYRWKIL